jgi:hypothetical protein
LPKVPRSPAGRARVEVVAAYELAAAIGENVPVTEIAVNADEIYAMLTKLIR